MSYSVDATILLYASDASSPHHARAAEFLARCASDGEPCCLTWGTVMGYLRMSTHPGIFGAPLSPEEAMRNIDGLLALPHVRVVPEGEGFWGIYRALVDGLAVRGNLVPDAHMAALLRQHDVRVLYTNDTDFRKFDFLDVRNPL